MCLSVRALLCNADYCRGCHSVSRRFGLGAVAVPFATARSLFGRRLLRAVSRPRLGPGWCFSSCPLVSLRVSVGICRAFLPLTLAASFLAAVTASRPDFTPLYSFGLPFYFQVLSAFRLLRMSRHALVLSVRSPVRFVFVFLSVLVLPFHLWSRAAALGSGAFLQFVI